MRGVYMVATLAAAAAVLAPSAAAKGPIQLCGPEACSTFAEEGALPRLLVASSRPGSMPLRPYYVVRFRDLGGPLAYWVPASGLLRWGQQLEGWRRPSAETAATLAAAAGGLRPHAPPRVADVIVDGRKLRRGAEFLRLLFTAGVPAAAPRAAWLEVFLFGVESPWTDGLGSVWVSRSGAYLRRGAETFRVSPAFATSVRDGLPLR